MPLRRQAKKRVQALKSKTKQPILEKVRLTNLSFIDAASHRLGYTKGVRNWR